MTMRVTSILLLLAHLAHARVGETLAECTARYGAPEVHSALSGMHLVSGPGTTNAIFDYHGWYIRLGFIDGKARVADYHKQFKTNQIDRITDAEFTSILKAYQAEPWETIKDPFTLNPLTALASSLDRVGKGDSWRSRMGLVAYRRPGGSIVHIEDPAALQAQAERIARERAKNTPPPPKF